MAHGCSGSGLRGWPRSCRGIEVRRGEGVTGEGVNELLLPLSPRHPSPPTLSPESPAPKPCMRSNDP